MKNFFEVIKETEKRYKENKTQRDNFKEKLKIGFSNQADDSKRIAERLKRLSKNSAFSMRESFGVDISRPEPNALERIMGKSDLISISYLEQGQRVSRSVGRIRLRNQFGKVIGFGTGFMVSPRLLFTNNHVLENSADAKFSQIEFNFQKNWNGDDLGSIIFDLQPDVFFLTDPTLDYSLVAVKESSVSSSGSIQKISEIGWNLLIEEENKVIIGECLNIIQHPNGEPKQIALRENKLVDRLESFLHYETDTAPGSSGSPVFNDQWEVVALHHSGVPRRDENGNILARDGKIWTENMGEHRVDWLANEGVRVSRLLKHLKSQNLASETQKKLLNEVFELVQPNLPEVVSVAKTDNLFTSATNTKEPKTENSNMKSDSSLTTKSNEKPENSITWTIPLNITVQLGAISTTAEPPKTASILKSVKNQDENPDLKAALAELETARNSAYYEAESDNAEAVSYYADIVGDASPAQFFTNLSQLVRRTHSTKLSYKPAVHLYPEIDLHEDGKIQSIYSGQSFDPEELIREDFRIDLERANILREKALLESDWSAEKMALELDLLEAGRPYNCEHVVPQSWFGKREPMRGDLHHLFACEMRCNSFRSNTPYFDFADFNEVVRTDCGKSEGNKFEPFGGKGAVARATLYFLLRYPGEINDNSQEFEENRLEVLLRWHRENDVSLYEKHRNAVIFKKQGNRNPFIDFPELAEKVDFSLGLG